MNFTAKKVLVTGGASGIGKATAEAFQKAGAQTAILDIACKSFRSVRGNLEIPCDLSDAENVKLAFAQLWERWNSLDVLVNSAGVEYTSDLEQTTEEGWDRVLNVNLKSVFRCCQESAPYLKSSQGNIVNTASQLAFVGVPGLTAYVASKTAIVGFTRTLALEMAPFGVRVNCICPGAIDTPMIQRQFTNGKKGPQGSFAELVALHPLGRLGQPEEIAACILFLSSPLASFITGSALIADGGYTIR